MDPWEQHCKSCWFLMGSHYPVEDLWHYQTNIIKMVLPNNIRGMKTKVSLSTHLKSTCIMAMHFKNPMYTRCIIYCGVELRGRRKRKRKRKISGFEKFISFYLFWTKLSRIPNSNMGLEVIESSLNSYIYLMGPGRMRKYLRWKSCYRWEPVAWLSVVSTLLVYNTVSLLHWPACASNSCFCSWWTVSNDWLYIKQSQIALRQIQAHYTQTSLLEFLTPHGDCGNICHQIDSGAP